MLLRKNLAVGNPDWMKYEDDHASIKWCFARTVESLAWLFFAAAGKSAASLEALKTFSSPDILSWDVSMIQDFTDTFKGLKGFNQNISRWNVSNGEKIGGMFQSALALTL